MDDGTSLGGSKATDVELDLDRKPPNNNKTTTTSIKPKSAKKTRRGYGKKNNGKEKHNIQEKDKHFSVTGVNCNGLKGKWDSLKSNIVNHLESSIITLQETKQVKSGNWNIDNYKIFERTRDSKGGGLMTIVDSTLYPILTHVGNDENELLTVEVNVNGTKIRVVNGYGPQEDADENVVLSFWREVEVEIIG